MPVQGRLPCFASEATFFHLASCGGGDGLRRSDEIEFITIILWDSLDDVRAVADDDYERAIIPADRLPLLTRYDAKAAHYEVVSTVERAPA